MATKNYLTDYEAKEAAQRAKLKETAKLACAELAKVGVDFVVFNYDGSGDSGQIEDTNIYAYKSKKRKRDTLSVVASALHAGDGVDELDYMDSNDYASVGKFPLERWDDKHAQVSALAILEEFVYATLPGAGKSMPAAMGLS